MTPVQIGTRTWWLRFASHDVWNLGDFLVGFTVGTLQRKVQWYQWAGLECGDCPGNGQSGGEVIAHIRKKYGVGHGPVPLSGFRPGFGPPESA